MCIRKDCKQANHDGFQMCLAHLQESRVKILSGEVVLPKKETTEAPTKPVKPKGGGGMVAQLAKAATVIIPRK